jgi:NADH dehydrogenase
VLTRHADTAATDRDVEFWTGDVADADSIRGAAAGCDAVLHLVAIVDESPPNRTFESVNVAGTANVLAEAARNSVPRFVFVSSLGAQRGESGYHASKRAAEALVRAFAGSWLIIRPGAVFGPGDEHISILLRMVRSLPVVPVIGGGDRPFQPIWHEDLAEVLARAVERDDVTGALEVGGREVTSQAEIAKRFRKITGRSAPLAPLPELLASWGIRVLDTLGVEPPISESQLQMLLEDNVIPPGRSNALMDVFGLTPTPLDEALRKLSVEQPEQLPSSGVGPLTHKQFWVDLADQQDRDRAVFARLREHLPELFPAPLKVVRDRAGSPLLERGATLTVHIPVRGEAQVRVAHVGDTDMTLLTVEGHPLAGAVRLSVVQCGPALRFQIDVYDRAATRADELLLRVAGDVLQRATWVGLCEKLAQSVAGSAPRVHHTERVLDEDAERAVEAWLAPLRAQGSPKSTSSGRD